MARALKPVDAFSAAELMKAGALMVDVREPGEYAHVRIPGSENVALSRLEATAIPVGPHQAIVFFCAGGSRTIASAARLAAKAGNVESYVMQGGLSAWGQAGLPLERGGSPPTPRAGFFSRLLR
jgi:rhodanese-related sulfurtransferase